MRSKNTYNTDSNCVRFNFVSTYRKIPTVLQSSFIIFLISCFLCLSVYFSICVTVLIPIVLLRLDKSTVERYNNKMHIKRPQKVPALRGPRKTDDDDSTNCVTILESPQVLFVKALPIECAFHWRLNRWEWRQPLFWAAAAAWVELERVVRFHAEMLRNMGECANVCVGLPRTSRCLSPTQKGYFPYACAMCRGESRFGDLPDLFDLSIFTYYRLWKKPKYYLNIFLKYSLNGFYNILTFF